MSFQIGSAAMSGRIIKGGVGCIMDEKEIQATIGYLAAAWAKDSKVGMALEAFKLASDTLVKLTRMVEAVEVIASCQIDVTEAIVDGAANETLETVQTEGTC